MKPTNIFKTLYLSRFSKPASNRPIYRKIIREKARYILELGIDDGKRALRMIEAAARFTPRREIKYVGLDLFEARNESDRPGLSLINAHRLLKQSGAKIKLIPGDPLMNLPQKANELGQVDLLLISGQF
ncbi:MAG: hypothetical protein ACWGMZ_13025, partial [Thermoguttaceae bacterium]